MGVRTAACLHIGQVLRFLYITDIENSYTAKSLFTHCSVNTFSTTIKAAAESFTRYKQQVLIHRNITLRCRAKKIDSNTWILGIADIPDNESIVITLDGVIIDKCEIRVC